LPFKIHPTCLKKATRENRVGRNRVVITRYEIDRDSKAIARSITETILASFKWGMRDPKHRVHGKLMGAFPFWTPRVRPNKDSQPY